MSRLVEPRVPVLILLFCYRCHAWILIDFKLLLILHPSDSRTVHFSALKDTALVLQIPVSRLSSCSLVFVDSFSFDEVPVLARVGVGFSSIVFKRDSIPVMNLCCCSSTSTGAGNDTGKKKGKTTVASLLQMVLH